MKRMMIFLSAMTFVAFTFASTGVFASDVGKMNEPAGRTTEPMVKSSGPYDALGIGKEVKNMEGEDLGTVKEFVKDSDGRVSFAILSTGGFMGLGDKKVAIPYSALTFNTKEDHYTTSISKDQLANAPTFENEAELRDRSFADEVYRHFGQRPYWSEESKGAPGFERTNPPRGSDEFKGTEPRGTDEFRGKEMPKEEPGVKKSY
jgi:PRC-barrel domain